MKPILRALPLLAMLWAAAATAASPAAPSSGPPGGQAAAQGPTRITAQRMVYAQADNAATFERDVYVKRPDLELWADRMAVTFARAAQAGAAAGQPAAARPPVPAEAAGGGQIEKIIATGNVRFVYAGRYNGTCGKATYLAAQELIILEDKPVVVQEGNTLQGEVIRLYLRDNRSEVAGAKNRPVEMLFTPGKGEKK